MESLLKSFQKKLTNLSGSNRSLLFLKVSSYDLDIHSLNFFNKLPSFHIIEELIAKKSQIKLCPVQDSRDESANELSRKIKKIKRRDEFVYQERGATDLYVGWPFVRGKFQDGSLIQCPLLFFPVKLTQSKDDWNLELRKDVSVTFNKSFLLAYAHYNGVRIQEEILEASLNDFDKDFVRFRVELYNILKESPIELNFNQELLEDKLVSFQSSKKADLEKKEGLGMLKMYPQAILGFFPQAGSYQTPDYDDILKQNQYSDIENLFIEKSPFFKTKEQFPLFNSSGEKAIKEEQLLHVFPSDASQERVARLVKLGKSLVVQGPPGTGKSQLISNMVSDFISKGKKVLVVCQKRAALDVVYERLDEAQITPYLSLVHDFKNDRKTVYEKINYQIEKIEEYKSRNNELDTIYLERNFLKSSRKIDEIVEELEEYKSALFDTSESGLSVKELYLTSDPTMDYIPLNELYRYFTKEKIKEFSDKLPFIWPYTQRFENESYLWKDRLSFAGKGVQFKKELETTFDQIVKIENEFRKNGKKIVGEEIKIEVGIKLYDLREKIDHLTTLLESERVFKYFQYILDKNPDEEWLFVKERIIMELYRDGLDLSIPTSELGSFHKVFDEYLKARKNIFQRIKWKLFRKDKLQIKRAMIANDLRWASPGFKIMENRLNHRLNLEHIVSELEECSWLIEAPTNLGLDSFQKWFNAWHVAIEAKKIADQLREFAIYFNLKTTTYQDFKSKSEKLVGLSAKLNLKHSNWLKLLSQQQLKRIFSNLSSVEDYLSVLNKDFDTLCEYDQLLEQQTNKQREVQLKLFDERGNVSTEEIKQLFENSIRLAWIDHIEIKYPILRIPSTSTLDLLEKDLENAIGEKKKLSNDILILKLREQTYANVAYNRLHNMITYRELKHQVTKKRKIWPIRKLMEDHGHEVLDLMPCWLMSPESVSAIFPLQNYFDLVIFDEASQCYVEKGFPAFFRGKQLVILGDSKQLKPNDLYSTRWEDEEEDQAAFNVDSLLGFSSLYLENAQLQGHYRSDSLELIDFSNQHFYEGSLQLLPSKENLNIQEPAISYEKVNGIWESGKNEIEAEKVVELINKLIKTGQEDIGVVTFNAKQQDYIQDLLEKKSQEESWNIPDSVFVKNIENVQGDEREIIIFSISYAPDKKGKVNTQFGSLSIDGGENRLNVAITRAKKKVIVVTSILPSDLKVESAKNIGPKLFKSYLNYALDVSNKKYTPTLSSQLGFGQEWYLKKQVQKNHIIKENKVEVVDDFPFSDLLLKKNGIFVNVISTDDDLYFSNWSVKSSHGNNKKMLKKKGWNNQRLYSRNYWKDRQSIGDSILRILGEK